MTQDEIIRMAREAGMLSINDRGLYGDFVNFERFADLVAAYEREACAKLFADEDCLFEGKHIAAAIRARGLTKSNTGE